MTPSQFPILFFPQLIKLIFLATFFPSVSSPAAPYCERESKVRQARDVDSQVRWDHRRRLSTDAKGRRQTYAVVLVISGSKRIFKFLLVLQSSEEKKTK
ncbi:hypothetical protein TNCV_437641 [Trichonephila clavipes]|nr:hypothetical protein TNCV_437641 [Trichonephila clavipes]